MSRTLQILSLGVCLALGLVPFSRAADDVNHEDLAELPHFVDEIMVRWEVPGAAVAVVRGGEVVFAGGFGVGDLEKRNRITGKSLFGIGSVTKSLTALAVGALVDEGKLQWDEPVRSYMPDFSLRDASATLHSTPRDLLAHRTGLPRHDAVWYRSPASREELYSRLRYLQPACELRACFDYNNLMYLVAGLLVERSSGMSWERFVDDRIFGPLGMERSFFGEPPASDGDVAFPHERARDGTVVRVPFYHGWAAGPAGSVTSCAEDMARWLIYNLGGEAGEFIVSKETLQETHRPQVVVGRPATAAFPLTDYALGWFVQTYRGRLFLWHTGSIDGYYALVGFLPFDDLGVAVLTNRSQNRVPEVVSRWVIDRFLGLGEINWHSYFVEQEETIRKSKEAAREAVFAKRDPGSPPSLPLERYAGLYRHPAYGDLGVSFEDGGLSGTYHGISGTVEHFVRDIFVFEVTGEVFEEIFQMSFRVDANHQVSAVTSPLAKGLDPIVFLRVTEGGTSDNGAHTSS